MDPYRAPRPEPVLARVNTKDPAPCGNLRVWPSSSDSSNPSMRTDEPVGVATKDSVVEVLDRTKHWALVRSPGGRHCERGAYDGRYDRHAEHLWPPCEGWVPLRYLEILS